MEEFRTQSVGGITGIPPTPLYFAVLRRSFLRVHTKCHIGTGSTDSFRPFVYTHVGGRKEQTKIAVHIGFVFDDDASNRARILHPNVRRKWN